MNSKNNTGNAKYDTIASDYRVTNVRRATEAEAEGDKTGVVVELHKWATFEGACKFLAFGVKDARNMLKCVIESTRDEDYE